MEKKYSLVDGPIGRGLLYFVLPLMLSSLVQQLYVTVDAVVVGRFAGKTALAAIDSVHTLFKFPINFMNGLAAGTTILISRHFGEKSSARLRSGMLAAGLMASVLGAICSIGGVTLSRTLVGWMQVPEGIYAQSLTYTRIYFSGLWALIIYNMAAGVLRSFGDSRSPLIILLITTAVNIVGDLLLVAVFGQGVAGAAAATVFSQFVSAAIAVYLAYRKMPSVTESESGAGELIASELSEMVRTGMPLAFQSMLFPIANSITQAAVNSMGTDSIAAWGICDKLDMVIWLIADAMSPALTTYTAQNLGAGRPERVRRGVHIGTAMSVGAVAAVSAVLYLLTGVMAAWFVPESDAAAVVPLCVQYMHGMAPFFIFYAVAEAFSGACCGTGDTVRPMVLTLLSICLLRVVGVIFVLPHFANMECIVGIYVASWIASGVCFTLLWIYKSKNALYPRQS